MSQAEKKTAARGAGGPIEFFRGFLRNPGGVGSVIPSSRFLERQIIRAADLDHARCVVELGPGTGGTTARFLERMPETGALMAVELDQGFAELLAQKITDPRLSVFHGSAEHIQQALEERGLPAPDAVISGIPFSTIPQPIGEGITKAVYDCLAPGGRFVAYQFRGHVAERAEHVFGKPEVTVAEFLNIPPMRVYRWTKPGLNGEG
jgi:phospholipid N-methyltransferase